MSKKQRTKDLTNVVFSDCQNRLSLLEMIDELGLEISSVWHGDTLCVQYK